MSLLLFVLIKSKDIWVHRYIKVYGDKIYSYTNTHTQIYAYTHIVF